MCEMQKVPQSPKAQKIQSSEKVTLGVDPKVTKSNEKVTKRWQKQGKCYFLVTCPLLFRYFGVDLQSEFFVTFSLL